MENETVKKPFHTRAIEYTKYIAGETLLIVQGILIALQIDNGNQARQDSIQSSG